MTRTKIVATIGPSTASDTLLDDLLAAGVNVARVNCAHSIGEPLRDLISAIRRRGEAKEIPLALLADLGGPKLRIGTFRNGGVEQRAGRSIVLCSEAVEGSEERVQVSHPELVRDVKPGDRIYLNDGLIRLEVADVSESEIHTVVKVGGWLSDRKGISAPSVTLSVPALTYEDLEVLDILAGVGVDYIGLSFVRSVRDVERLRKEMDARSCSASIVAKIETAQAVKQIDEIIDAADAVMIARGDLGVECPMVQVPVFQKQIIRSCNEAGVPVITATQMLESMVGNPRPTRAEATDVTNAVIDGSDALMLSAETAMGQFPVETVRVMQQLIGRSEEYISQRDCWRETGRLSLSAEDAVARSACQTAESVEAEAIVCLTESGATARRIAKWRPSRPVFAMTPQAETWRKLSLVWGIKPMLVENLNSGFDTACCTIVDLLLERSAVKQESQVVITAGLPFAQRHSTNTLRVERAYRHPVRSTTSPEEAAQAAPSSCNVQAPSGGKARSSSRA
jgi:pyruvate kinase